MSSQSFQPILEVTDASTSRSVQAYSDFEIVYNGGGSIAFKGTLEQNRYIRIRLFQGELVLEDVPLVVMYSSMSNGDSQLGLSLELFSSTNKRKVLLASSTEKQFSSDYSEVIETTPLKVPGLHTDWFVHVGRIQMNGYKLTNINVVCYRSSPETGTPIHKSGVVGKSNTLDCNSLSEYFAVFGNIIVRSVEEPDLPPSSSWLVESPYVRRTTSPGGTKTLDVHIIWKLKDSCSDKVFERYNVYVMEVAEEGKNLLRKLQNVPKYFGMAHVKAFYVSTLPVPSSTSGFKFIIQVCGVDGSVQRLEDAPFLYLSA